MSTRQVGRWRSIASLQSPLRTDGFAILGRAHGLHTGSGLEKGRVESQVGNVREWLFTSKPCFTTLADLRAPRELLGARDRNRYNVECAAAGKAAALRAYAESHRGSG